MRKYLILFIILAFLTSCGNKKNTTPHSTSVINKKKMATVLVDVYLAEASLMTTMQEGRNSKELTVLYYNYIFNNHNISRIQYINSMQYYSFHLKEMKEVYNDVINQLTVLQNKPKRKPVD